MNYCKMCFNPIKERSFFNLTHNKPTICEACFRKFNPQFIKFNIGSIKALAIYEYDMNIKDLLYKLKGCYDIELKDVFLDRYISYLKIKYYGYYLLPLPSYIKDDEKRGFNHVVEIYNRLNLPMLKILEKVDKSKQSSKKKKERLAVAKHFAVSNLELVKNKKILIVDDIYTTGASINAAIELIKQGKPKKIQVLVVAKNVDKSIKT